MSAIDYHLKQAEEKAQEWVEFLATYPDKRLVKRLAIVRKQLAIARQNEDEKGYELMLMWEHITICARMHKEEYNIPDALVEKEEIQPEAIIAITEKRQELLKEALKPKHNPEPATEQNKNTSNEDEIQLSLF
jgi:hypothetical protein